MSCPCWTAHTHGVAALLWLHCHGVHIVHRRHHAATVPPCPVTTHAVAGGHQVFSLKEAEDSAWSNFQACAWWAAVIAPSKTAHAAPCLKTKVSEGTGSSWHSHRLETWACCALCDGVVLHQRSGTAGGHATASVHGIREDGVLYSWPLFWPGLPRLACRTVKVKANGQSMGDDPGHPTI